MRDADDQEKADSIKAAEKDSTFDRVEATLDHIDERMGSVTDGDGVHDRVQDLTWALLDDHIDDAEVRQLEQLLTDGPKARQTYIDCIQLHTGLMSYFAEQQAKDDPGAPTSPFP